jgi:hypothetical protein
LKPPIAKKRPEDRQLQRIRLVERAFDDGPHLLVNEFVDQVALREERIRVRESEALVALVRRVRHWRGCRA